MFKNILLNVSNTDGQEARVHWAINFAKKHKSTVRFAYILTPASIPDEVAGRCASNAYIAEVMEIAREKESVVHTEIEEMCKKNKIPFTWNLVEGDPVERMTYLSNLCDLCIFSQLNPKHSRNRFLKSSPETLMFKTGATILLMPNGQKPKTIGKRIMVCWKNSRGAIRAVRGASHLFPDAEKIFVLTGTKTDPDGTQAKEIIDYIKSRGAKASVIEDLGNVNFAKGGGPTILEETKKHHCDLIVMGGYGHSRMREMILGGTTRYMLRHMETPIMMAH